MEKVCGIGEILIRYSNLKNQQFTHGDLIEFNFGGAEYNMICNLANWGNKCYFLSKLGRNWLTHQAIANFKRYGVKTNFIIKDQDANARLGTNYLLKLQGTGISEAIYDRKNTSFCHLKADEIDEQKLFEKVDTIYLSGIPLATDPQVQEIILNLVKNAKQNGKTIVFDFNYRAKLWNYADAKKAYERILPYCDIISCNLNDIKKILKLTDGIKETNDDQEIVQAYQKLMKKYPNLKLICQTKREIVSPNEQNYQGYLFNGQKLFKSPKYNVKNFLDRVGSGDAFTAGLCHSLINHQSEQNVIDFATKAGAIKHFYNGDNNDLKLEHIELFHQNEDISR